MESYISPTRRRGKKRDRRWRVLMLRFLHSPAGHVPAVHGLMHYLGATRHTLPPLGLPQRKPGLFTTQVDSGEARLPLG